MESIFFYFILFFSSSELLKNRYYFPLEKSPLKYRLLFLNSSLINSPMGANNTTKRSQQDIQAYLDKEKEKFIEKYENPIRQNAQLDEFELIRTVGTGSFGMKKSDIE